MDIFDLAHEFRRKLLTANNELLKDIARGYAAALKRIEADYDRLVVQAPENEGFLAQATRLAALRDRLSAELEALNDFLAGRLTEAQRSAVAMGVDYARAAVGGEFLHPDPGALRRAVGFLREGPVREVLLRRAGAEAQALAETIETGLILGRNPREIGREIRDRFGLKTVQAMTLARTETLRAYREAALDSFRRNRHVVQSWVWHANPSKRTCALCLARHGQRYGMEMAFTSHPNCRCVPVPVTRDWGEVLETRAKIPESRPEIYDSNAYFAGLDYETQLKHLGRTRFLLYRVYGVPWQDMIEDYWDPVWGLQSRLRPVRKLLDMLDITEEAIDDLAKAWAERLPYESRRAALESVARKVSAYLEDLLGRKSRWTGAVWAGAENFYGLKRWDCVIELNLKKLDEVGEARLNHTLVHEICHGLSANVTPRQYAELKGYEEGLVEALTIHFAPKISEELGIPVTEYGNPLYQFWARQFFWLSGLLDTDFEDLAKILLKMDLVDRREYIRSRLALSEFWEIDDALRHGPRTLAETYR